MFIRTVTDEQYEYASRMVAYYNFGRRGRGDGNEAEQLTGIIGQTVLADLLGLERPSGENGFDGGVDFNINGKRVDVKTMTRTTDVRDYYVHNFIGYQRNYNVDYYIFQSYNKTNREMTICGYIDKESFFEKAEFYEEGSLRTRSDGTSFHSKAPLYEIRQTELEQVDTLEQLIEFFN